MKTITLTLETGDLYYHEFRELVQLLQKSICNTEYEIKIVGHVSVNASIDPIGYAMN